MPRPRLQEPTTRWTLRIEKSLSDRFCAIIDDQVTGEPMRGARRKVIESLLKSLIEEIEQGTAYFDPITGRIVRKDNPKPRS